MYPILYLSSFRHSFALLQPSHVKSMSSEHIYLLAIVGSFSMGKGLVFGPPDIKFFSLRSVSVCLSVCEKEGWVVG